MSGSAGGGAGGATTGDAGAGGTSVGGGGAIGAGGTGGAVSPTGGAGRGCTPDIGDGRYTCPAGSPAMACGLRTSQLLPAGNDIFLIADRRLLKVGDAGLTTVISDLLLADQEVAAALIDVPYLYYLVRGGGADFFGKVMRRRLDGSAAPEEILSCPGTNFWGDGYAGMIADANAVYLHLERGIYRVEKSTTPPAVTLLSLASGIYGSPKPMAVDDRFLYTTRQGGLQALNKTGTCSCACATLGGAPPGSPSTIQCSTIGTGGASGGTECSLADPTGLLAFDGLQRFALDTGSIYFATNATLYRAPREGGGAPVAIVGSGSPNPSVDLKAGLFATDETSLYASLNPIGNPVSLGFQIAKIPKGTSAVTILGSDAPPRYGNVNAIEAAGGVVYTLVAHMNAATACYESELYRFPANASP
jgi:hypothetical protein